MTMDQKKKRLHNSGACVSLEKKACIDMFDTWSCNEQVDFICSILSRMSHFQQSQVNSLLEPLLKRDFIVAFRTHGVPHLAEQILTQLDALSLLSVELVSRGWQWSVAKYQLWRRLIVRRIGTDAVWHGLAERRRWLQLVYLTDPDQLPAALEQRRISLGLRQKMSDLPLFSGPFACHAVSKPCVEDTKSQHQDPCCHCHGDGDGNNPITNHIRCTPQSRDVTVASVHVAPYTANRCREVSLDSPISAAPSSPAPIGTSETPNGRSRVNHSFTLETDRDDASFDAIMFAHRFYKQLYPRIIKEIKRVEDNWSRGNYHLTRIPCRSDVTKGVYCLQYDKEKIVSGLRDDTIKVWRRFDVNSPRPTITRTAQPVVPRPSSAALNVSVAAVGNNDPCPGADEARPAVDRPADEAMEAVAVAGGEGFATDVGSDGYHCTQVLEGHTGSVLCLQYIGNLLISGSSDTTVRLWDLSMGRCLNVINHHAEAVLHLRFRNNVLVTCSKDRSIAVWDMGPWPRDVQLRQVLVGHRAAVNVVDFDDKYIVSASGDRTIKVWCTDTCAYVRTLTGHRRGIACLQYRDRLVVSGSSDNTIRIWDIETGVCFRVLEGHEELVRCIRFDSKHIVSGAYDGKIKVWSLKHALDPRAKPSQLCIHTLQQHTGRVFRLQFDDFQIVSSSHDDTILIWDFVRPSAGTEEHDDGFDDEIHTALASQAQCLCLPASNSHVQTSPGPSSAPTRGPTNTSSHPSQSTPCTSLMPIFQNVTLSSYNALHSGAAACVEMENEPTAPNASSASGTIRVTTNTNRIRRTGNSNNATVSARPATHEGNERSADTPTCSHHSSMSFRNLYSDS
ncbi:unnamed protein product [Dicrocoelium dendriticum]|nr:unnamed protein product [Dicrocoelium dendriticum]